MVEGFYNPAHIIRTFIANEYAFSYFFEDREIRVAHSKGTWTFAKVTQNVEASDWFSWGDGFSGVESPNELTKAFANSLREQYMETQMPKLVEGDLERTGEAEVISRVLEVWAGKSKNVMSITVRQPGRNAWIDEESLEFSFSPRREEFRN